MLTSLFFSHWQNVQIINMLGYLLCTLPLQTILSIHDKEDGTKKTILIIRIRLSDIRIAALSSLCKGLAMYSKIRQVTVLDSNTKIKVVKTFRYVRAF
jgi:hypothetical protein